MMKNFLSRSLVLALMLSIPGNAILAQNNEAKERQTRLEQLKSYYNAFERNMRSYIRCIMSGECESERQKAIVAEIGSIARQIVTALIVIGSAWGVSKIVKQQISEAGQAVTEELRRQLERTKVELPLGQRVTVVSQTREEFEREMQAKRAELDRLRAEVAEAVDQEQKRLIKIAEQMKRAEARIGKEAAQARAEENKRLLDAINYYFERTSPYLTDPAQDNELRRIQRELQHIADN